MPTLAFTDFNIVCATLGGFVAAFGLVSYLLKETFNITEPLVSLIAGFAFSPHVLNLIRPERYAHGSIQNVDAITLFFARLVLGIQLVITGVQLPPRYLRSERKPLLFLLGPGMTIMWLCGSALVWALVPSMQLLFALVLGACITPTDPVLSYSIIKGGYADQNVPLGLRNIIIAESGANDGLGYPFLFLALYLIKFRSSDTGISDAVWLWVRETWIYVVVFSVVYGAVVGWLGRAFLRFADRKHLVEHDSLKFTSIALALFIVGTCGTLGTDDVLACFVAGNIFNWDGWFSHTAKDESVHNTIDKLLNITIFIWFGAVCPWPSFLSNEYMSFGRLITLAILVLVCRRLPLLLMTWKAIPPIENWHQAFFTGFFGPIGVSAVFYLYVTVDFLGQIATSSTPVGVRMELDMLQQTTRIVVWFLVVSSVVVHGLSVPIIKLANSIPYRMTATGWIRLE